MLSSISDWLTTQIIYVALSAIIAILIWCEAEMLKKTEGKLPESKFFHISSVLDTGWFFVSLWVLFTAKVQALALAVPVAYAIYTVFGWIYGTRLLRRKGIPDSADKLVVPMRYVAYSQSFALIFFALCLLVLAAPWLPLEQLNNP